MKKAMAIVLMVCILLTSYAYAENATATLQDLYAQAELVMQVQQQSLKLLGLIQMLLRWQCTAKLLQRQKHLECMI